MEQSASFPHLVSECADFPLLKIIVQFCDHIIFTGTTGKFSNGRIWSEWLMYRVNAQRLGIASSKF